uniref:Uncharacterized protein n=1 Tax=Plectus sambesii TaxID=2011161 RepID=A0A914VVV8_9BILA
MTFLSLTTVVCVLLSLTIIVDSTAVKQWKHPAAAWRHPTVWRGWLSSSGPSRMMSRLLALKDVEGKRSQRMALDNMIAMIGNLDEMPKPSQAK